MAWTIQQENVITHRGSNLLVSAAAGSGKTAVLVERILQRITDPDHPADIDRILVVTFTKAAAAEMRERIGDALTARLEADPGNANLQRQSALLQNAKISTIDSFCQSVIRNQFYRINLEPAFRIGDEGEMKVMRQDVIDALFEELYACNDQTLVRLAEHFSKDRSDNDLKEIILQIYDYAMSEPWPRKWLEECRQMYRGFTDEAGTDNTWLHSPWMQEVTENIRGQIAGIADAYPALIAQALSPDGPYMYENALESDRRQFLNAAKAENFIALRNAALSFYRETLKICGKKDADPELKDQVQKGRNKLLKKFDDLKKDYFSQEPGQLHAQMREAAPDALALCDLTETFMEAFAAHKRSRNVLDFSDQEHFALQILVDEETQLPTETAREYQDFFEEIMIDEYQDSNYVQELLLTSISRQETGRPNLFMVGDVKQSIYGFRLARPDLFMEKYRTYVPDSAAAGNDMETVPAEDGMQQSGDSPEADAEKVPVSADAQQIPGRFCGRRIELGVNFRSRPSVLRCVNAVFFRLMQEDIGGITYGTAEALCPGEGIYPAEDPDANNRYRTEILLTDKGIEAETARIAQRIRELTDPADPLMITDKGADAPRPVRYHDIVILMRSLGEKADKMAQQLTDAGIPAHVQSKKGYFSSLEVRTLLSFLQIIDNPRQDIPLAAVLRSPVYGFTGDDLARLRIESRQTDFYDAVLYYAADGPDAVLQERLSAFLADLDDYRRQSTLLQIHELLAYLLRRSGYDKIVSAMPGGTQRLTNIRMLQESAAAFEKTSYRGLFAFNRYMEQLDTYDVDYGEASAVGENDDAVRILTIHKSKGLEYPVVFLSALGGKFNRQDQGKSVQLHARCGIGIDVFYRDRRTKTPTILKKAVRLMNETESVGEEMRVLYVAMTRAREKLILTAAGDNAAKWEKQLKSPQTAGSAVGKAESIGTMRNAVNPDAVQTAELMPDGRCSLETAQDADGALQPISFYNRLTAGCFMDWIAEALSGTGICDVHYVPAEDLARADAQQIVSRRMKLPELAARLQNADPALTEKLSLRFAAAHRKAAPADLPAKVSVSELKLDRIRENGEDPEELFADTHQKHYVPDFAREDSAAAPANSMLPLSGARDVQCTSVSRRPEQSTEAARAKSGSEGFVPPAQNASPLRSGTGASYGTAVHRVMECLDFAACADAMEAASAGIKNSAAASHAAESSAAGRREDAARRVPAAHLNAMLADGRITKQIHDMVSRRALAAFLESDLFRRMAAADRRGKLVKERPFVMSVPATEIQEDAPTEETVLVQGIIDAYFEEDGKIILVDYKTDRVNEPQELISRYRRQMELYAQALRGGTGKNVTEKLLYSFAPDTQVPVL